jgi:ABC-type molybdate transport system ATPase subunit
MSKIFTLIAFILSTIFVQAQSIIGEVKDEKGKTINAASISLQKAKDSTVVKIAVADNVGKYSFTNIASGKYFVTVTALNYAVKKSMVFELNNNDVTVPEMVLTKAVKQLEGVTVTARKPMIEVKADKTILI